MQQNTTFERNFFLLLLLAKGQFFSFENISVPLVLGFASHYTLGT
jgi:hypothetical protein